MIELLVRNHRIPLPTAGESALPREVLATIVSNLAYYGYGLTKPTLEALAQAEHGAVTAWWPGVNQALAELTGDAKDIGAHVVYKNFPAEVLSKSEADYWIPQVLMYWGWTTSASPSLR